MAYRKLAVSYSNEGGHLETVNALLQRAYDHRDRLSDEERYSLEGYYFTTGSRVDVAKGIAAYESLLDLAPESQTGLINLAGTLESRGEYAKAEALFRRSLALDTLTYQSNLGLVRTLANQGKLDEASRAIAAGSNRIPRGKWLFTRAAANMLWANGLLDSAAKIAAGLPTEATSPYARAEMTLVQSNIQLARGKLTDGERLAAVASAFDHEAGREGNALAGALRTVVRTAWYRGDRVRAARQLDEVLKSNPLVKLSAVDRPFSELVDAEVAAGRLDAAKATLADFGKAFRSIGAVPDTNDRTHMEGTIALAEKKYDLAASKFREKTIDNFCPNCDVPRLAQTYDLAAKPDSAIAVYERYVQDRNIRRLYVDDQFLGPSLKRLGELYEAKGDRSNAAKQYTRFVELWKNADPELQPAVRDVRARLAKLKSTEPVKP